MDDALTALTNLTAVIQAEHDGVLSQFIVASFYESHIPLTAVKEEEKNGEGDDDDTEEEESVLSAVKPRVSTLIKDSAAESKGTWTIILGSQKGWYSTAFRGNWLQTTIREYTPEGTPKAFALRIKKSFEQRSFGISSSSMDADIRLDFKEYLEIYLDRLDPEEALEWSTRMHLITPSQPPASTSSYKLQSLQRKLDSTQQALREERHKYRSLLAAPSAANSRASAAVSRRPVVGLGPPLRASQSQRSSQQVGLPSSSPSAGPSSDGVEESLGSELTGIERKAGGQSQSQSRSMSLVNPTRVQRARPGEDEGFVGDSDDEFV